MELLQDSLSEGNWTPSKLGWLSPRISFSHDFGMLGRISPEKRKSDCAFDDDFYTEFEFSMSDASLNLQPPSTMLSAEELFFNGTLRPLHLLSRTGSADNLVLRHAVNDMAVINDEPLSGARHLSFDSSRCSSLRFENSSDNVRRRSCISLENSRCSSPSRSFSLPITAQSSPSPKTCNRFKDFFNLGKSHALISKDIPQYSAPFSIKLPLSPKSFWPFFRSKSADDAKSNAAALVMTCRSSSAGENKSSMSCTLPSRHRVDDESKKIRSTRTTPCSSLTQSIKDMKSPSVHAPLPHSELNVKVNNNSSGPASSSVSIATRSNAMEALCSQAVTCCMSGVSPSLPRATTPDKGGCPSLQRTQESHMTRCKEKGSPIDSDTTFSKYSKEDASSSASFSTTTSKDCEGLPSTVHKRVGSKSDWNVGCSGRSGEWISAASKGNSSRFVLRNLERCSASFNSRSMVRSQDLSSRDVVGGRFEKAITSPYSASVRVAPVLNVPAAPAVMTTGKKASRSSLFNLKTVFSKKGGPSPQPISGSTSTITSWRNARVGSSCSSSSSS
eukprot:c19919_g1_i1 orf=3-1673(-)